jgi:hypothetical protein
VPLLHDFYQPGISYDISSEYLFHFLAHSIKGFSRTCTIVTREAAFPDRTLG